MDEDSGLRCDGWLVQGGTVLASACIAATRSERRRGLLGRDRIDGVLVLPVRSVHTFGMKVPIDVAFCDADGRVLRLATVQPWRIATSWRAQKVVEAAAGAFETWGVRPGSTLEIRT